MAPFGLTYEIDADYVSEIRFRGQVVPIIRVNENASSRAGSRARTKTAACGAANRGFESHPARHLPRLGCREDLGFHLNRLLHLKSIFTISVVAVCYSGLDEAILTI